MTPNSFFIINYCVVGIDLETFLTLQERHIAEAFPQLAHRIKFENLYRNFLEKFDANRNNIENVIDFSDSVVKRPIFNKAQLSDCEIISSIIEVKDFREVSTQTEGLEQLELKSAEVQSE